MGYREWLSTTRKAAGRSQGALATACHDIDRDAGFAQARISDWERGASLPSFRQHVLMERALGLDLVAVKAGRDAWEAEQVGDLVALEHSSPNTETMTDAAVTGEPEGVTVGAGVP